MSDDVIDIWRIHARIVGYVLDAVDDAALTAATGLKGRSVAAQFAHIHQVRMMWLKAAGPSLLEHTAPIDKAAPPDKALLKAGLDSSAAAIEQLVAASLAAGRITGFKPHPTGFVGYLVAHESFHLGDIGVRLTEAGHSLSQKVAYGMWEWGSR